MEHERLDMSRQDRNPAVLMLMRIEPFDGAQEHLPEATSWPLPCEALERPPHRDLRPEECFLHVLFGLAGLA
eukprot:5672248-Pyramimonas_sp.AAC.1